MTIVLNGTTGITNDGAYTGDGVSFADGTPSNTLVTTTGGNVGIGTSSPSTRLNVVGSDGVVARFKGATGPNLKIESYSSNNEVVSEGGNLLVGTTNGALQLYTGTGTATERMRITSSGSLCFATTSETPASSSDTKGISFWTNGTSSQIFSTSSNDTAAVFNRAGSDGALIRTRRQGSDVGSISVTASATAYNTSSDYRLKENIAPMTGALSVVQQLKPVTYNWKVDGSAGQGFIAHELQAVVPECVTGEKDAVDEQGNPIYQGIDTSFLVATLTAAIQELKAELDTVKAELATLKGVA